MYKVVMRFIQNLVFSAPFIYALFGGSLMSALFPAAYCFGLAGIISLLISINDKLEGDRTN